MRHDFDDLLSQYSTALEECQKRFGRFINSIPGAIFEFCIDREGRRSLPYVSEDIFDLIGYSAAECMANVEITFDSIPLQERAALEASLEHSIKYLSPWVCEYPIYTSQGEKWLRNYSIPHQKEDGATCWRGIVVDITEQKKTEKSLRDNEQLFCSLPELASIGIFQVDTVGKYAYPNKRWLEISRFSIEDTFQRKWIGSVRPDDRLRVSQEWQAAIHSKSHFF